MSTIVLSEQDRYTKHDEVHSHPGHPISTPPHSSGLWCRLEVGPITMRFLTCAILLAQILICTFAFTGCRRLMGVHDPVTGSQVAPEEVPFLKLPFSASNIGFWDDGYQQDATFNISEEAFLQLFSDRKFAPISEETDYSVWTFGDTKNPPQKSLKTRTATDGLIHVQSWKNGGGLKIVFDRHHQFCAYELVRW
ncbi:hypothetical protein [Verrucomicrobium sp. BvORR106]|uniref:hypothetical protein n=1 Tax=Verrucomicrobium sp. BvORR106 TaxID=1403819 RepID=UPI002240ED06|nr:hypothetical protein [Verrucomicrobium sp. BvORR106]